MSVLLSGITGVEKCNAVVIEGVLHVQVTGGSLSDIVDVLKAVRPGFSGSTLLYTETTQ